MKKDRIDTISIREIKSSFKRFITIVLMSLLGVGTFVGLSATAPDMINSLDKYYDRQDYYDIKIISTLGISDNMIKTISNIDGVQSVTGSYSNDYIINFKDKESVVKVMSITEDINKIELLDGDLPKEKNEIVIESLMFDKLGINIGDYISYDNDNKSSLLKVVGKVKSPIYITGFKAMPDRGNTNIGTGKINFYAYVNPNFFDMDYYTEMYLKVEDSKKEITNSKKYNEIVDRVYSLINKKKSTIEEDRFNEIYNEYKDKIDDEKDKNEKKFLDAKALLDENYLKLLNAKKLLTTSKKKLDDGGKELKSKEELLISSKKELDNAKNELDNAKKTLDEAKEKIEKELSKYDLTYDYTLNLIKTLDKSSLTKADIISLIPKNIDNYNDIINTINDIYSYDINNVLSKEDLINSLGDIENKDYIISVIDTLYNFDLNNYKDSKSDIINLIPKDLENYDDIINTIDYYYDNSILNIIKDGLNSGISNIDNIITNIPKEITYYNEIVEFLNEIKTNFNNVNDLINGIEKIENGYKLYYDNLNKYEKGLKEYNDGYSLYLKYLDEYNKGKKEYEKGLKTYRSGLNLYNSKLEEYYNARKMFDDKIADAYKKLEDIPDSKLYIYTRLDDSEYSGYIDDSNSITNLSKLFPLVFFIVAVLISLVSMSRMVEDDRGLIGTLKSLGFSNYAILKKYLLYSGSATIMGGLIGSLLGFYLLSHYIFNMYKLLFTIDKFVVYYDLKYIIIGMLISIICICGTTIITVLRNVREKPAVLMRPKSPSSGKRVLLEHIPFIWKRLNFSNKITVRNLFRYKKRAILTIIGILGCTSLLLVGFALRDSIVNIPNFQFGNIFTFNDMVYLNDDSNIDQIFSNEYIKNYTKVKISTGSYDKNDINLLVPDDNKLLNSVINLRDIKTDKEMDLSEYGVIITDKISELSNTNVGEYIEFTDSNGEIYKFKVNGICKNYVGHYIFMDKNIYEKEVDKYKSNVVFLTLKDTNKDNEVTKELLSNKDIMGIMSINSTKTQVNNMLKVLDSVVLILILLSGGLSIVVLYNLSYINISEREREIATLKVLGFTEKEVDNYINRETIILTIIGIILGLIFGIFLSNIIVSTVEISMVRFIHKIEYISYILTAIIIFVFTLIINISAHYTLKKIDMIESLKSVE